MSDEAKSWPEFVGQDANEVEEKLKAEGNGIKYSNMTENTTNIFFKF